MKEDKKKVKAPRKERAPRKDFAERLADKLKGIGEIDEGCLSDDSGRWVSVQVGLMSLNFSFDMKGEKITDIGLYKDIVEVVDQKQLWTVKNNKQKLIYIRK